MLRRSKRYLKLRRVRHYGDIAPPRRNEILISTADDRLLEYGMPKMNKGNRPSWWADLPSLPQSYRRCYGITDLMQNGFSVNMWCDADITHNAAEQSLNVRLSSRDFLCESFSFDQIGHCPITDDRELTQVAFPKLVSPFHIRTPKGWSIMTFQHPLSYSRDYQVMPGIIHTDFYHEMNVVLNLMGSRDFTIKAGTPMLYCIPIRRSDAGTLKKIIHGGSEVSQLLQGHGMGYSGIFVSNKNHKGLYRQRLREAGE